MKVRNLTLGLLVSLLLVYNAMGARVEITPSSQTKNMGTSLTVNVTVKNVTDLFAAEFDLSFDASILQCDSFTEGSFLGSTIGFDPTIDNTNGTITGYAKSKTGASGVNGSGTLATFQFTTLGAGTSALTLSSVELKDSTPVEIPTSIVNGNVTVPAAEVEVIPYSQTKAVGSNFTINVTVSDVTDLFAAEFDLSFDSSVLECSSVTEGEFMGETTGFSPAIDNSAGNITGFAVTKTGSEGVSGVGILLMIEFTALAEGTSTLALSNVQLLDSSMTEIDITIENGSVTIEKLGDASGDDKVDIVDLGMVGQSWGSSSGDDNYNENSDLNGD